MATSARTPLLRELPRPRLLTSVFLLLAPVASALALVRLYADGWFNAIDLSVWLWCLAAFWSPHPLSMSAVVLDVWRDATLPETGRVRRAFLLLPAMLAPTHPARVAVASSLVGWVGCVLLVWGAVQASA